MRETDDKTVSTLLGQDVLGPVLYMLLSRSRYQGVFSYVAEAWRSRLSRSGNSDRFVPS